MNRVRTLPCCPYSSRQTIAQVQNMTGRTLQLAVCGLHLTGLPLNWQLTDLGATLTKACKSAAEYRLYAFTDASGKTKPGMIYVTDGTGAAIDLEVWALPIDKVGDFLQQIPAPLGLGTVKLEDGSSVKGFICEGWVAQPQPPGLAVKEITQLGGWRQYLASQQHGQP